MGTCYEAVSELRIFTGVIESKGESMEKQTFTGTIIVNDESFDDEVLQSDIPVLVDFWVE